MLGSSLLPGADDHLLELLGDEEQAEHLLVDDFLDQVQAHLVQGVGGEFELIDFERGELVGRGLVPVRLALEGVEHEPVFLDALLPVRPRVDV